MATEVRSSAGRIKKETTGKLAALDIEGRPGLDLQGKTCLQTALPAFCLLTSGRQETEIWFSELQLNVILLCGIGALLKR